MKKCPKELCLYPQNAIRPRRPNAGDDAVGDDRPSDEDNGFHPFGAANPSRVEDALIAAIDASRQPCFDLIDAGSEDPSAPSRVFDEVTDHDLDSLFEAGKMNDTEVANAIREGPWERMRRYPNCVEVPSGVPLDVLIPGRC